MQMTELKSVADEKRLECETLDAQLRKARSDIEMLNAQLREVVLVSPACEN